MVNNCSICNEAVDVNNGGCAIMLAFCRNHSTTLTNVSFCKECYDLFVDKNLRELDKTAYLKICFGEEE